MEEIKFKKLTGIEKPYRFSVIKIKQPTERVYELHKHDVLYCNIKFMEEQRYYNELLLGQTVYLNGTVAAKVVKVFKEKTNPDKKWWQFWIKQKEYATGYHLEIL